MVFSDLFFLFVFLPAFGLSYLLATWIDKLIGKRNSDVPIDSAEIADAKYTWSNFILVVFSFIFYAWGEPVYVFLMFFCVIVNYLSGRFIDSKEISGRKTALVIGLVINIAILGIFKYAGFFAGVLNDVGIPMPVPAISLPIGISFYIFQSISYLVDVYRRESPVQKKFLNLLLYISMFPQLIAGPIVRYGTIAHEISNRHVSGSDFADGLFRFLTGLGKKVILANQLSEISDQFLVNGLNDLSMSGAWIGVLAFTLQIYFDFSGYSDMAIGLGRCLGFHFNENFRHPYCCDSITDFWRRWHISLGSFFRDYVYIPLGGNRRHQALNILIVWFLTGMWHGASWNFIIWGVYFGLIVMLEKYTILKIKKYIPSVFLHIYSLLLVIIGWGIFYFDDFGKMQVFFNSFAGQGVALTDFLSQTTLTDYFWLWIVALVFCLPVREWCVNLLARMFVRKESGDNAVNGLDSSESSNAKSFWYRFFVYSARTVVSVVILVLSVALLVGATNNAFIYTRF